MKFFALFLLLSGSLSGFQSEFPKELSPLRSGHRLLSYEEARKYLFGKIHLALLKADGYAIQDIYCLKWFTDEDFPGGDGPSPMNIPDASVINTEHLWPQSHFGELEKDYKKSDLHHLYPSFSRMNSARGNLRFAEVESVRNPVCPNNKIGYAKASLETELYFEPDDRRKGDVARAVLYFSVRYKQKIEATEERFLRKWNKQDPPDQFEQSRNNSIEQIQGNRNPFVDNPSLADEVSDF